MSDTEHKVRISVTADIKQSQNALKQVTNEVKKVKTDTEKTNKTQLNAQKQIQKVTKDTNKQNKTEGPKQVQQAKILTREISAQNKELKNQLGLLQKINQATKRISGPGGPGGGSGGGRGGGRGGRGGRAAQGGKGGSGGGGGSSGGGIGGFLRGVGLGITGLGASALGALISMPFQAVGNQYQSYFNYMRSMGPLAGLAKGAPFGAGAVLGNFNGTDAGSINELKNRLVNQGYAPEEIAGGVRSFGRATGRTDVSEFGMSSAKLLGMEPGEIASFFGEMRKGQGNFGEKSGHDFQKILSAAVKSGVNASTLPEYLEGISNLTSRAGTGLGGAVSTLPYAQMLALFEKSGIAGLKGARGANVLSSMEEGFKNPAGEEGQAAVMASLGFGRVGGTEGFYQAKKQMQAGFQGEGGAGVFKNLIDYVDQITGGAEEANLYLEGLLGGRLGLDQIETVRKAFGEGKSDTDVQKMLSEMTVSELDVMRHIEDNTRPLKDFLHAAKRTADIQNKDIQAGSMVAGAVESIQDTMLMYLKEMMPAVKATLDGVAVTLEELRPVISRLGDVVEEVFGKDLSASELSTKRAEGLNDTVLAAVKDATVTEEERAQIRSNVEDVIADMQRQQYTTPEQLARGEAGMEVNPITRIPYTQAEQQEMFNNLGMSATREALYAALTQLMRGQFSTEEMRGMSIRGRVDTGPEMIAALQALGMNVHPGARAEIDDSGGAP